MTQRHSAATLLAVALLLARRLRHGRRRAPRSRRRPTTRTRRRPGRCASSPTATRSPTRCSTRSRRRTPTLELKVATFDSNKAAAAKLAGGFEADVVEVCTDEMEPLLARGLLRPLDPTGVDGVRQARLLRRRRGPQRGRRGAVRARLGRPARPDRQHRGDPGRESTPTQALFDPPYAGQVALEATPLTAIAASAMALGLDDPMNLTDEEVEEAKQHLLDNRDNFRAFAESDSSMVNLFKSGEVVLADGGRGTDRGDDRRRPAGRVGRAEGGRALVGLRPRDHLEGGEHRRRLQADQLLRLARGAGDLGRDGLRRDEPGRAARCSPRSIRDSADPRNLETAIAQTEPENADVYDRAWQEVLAQ